MRFAKEKKVIFVTGKGGVGKSLIAAAVAQEEAKKGRKVLLAEIGNMSYFKDFWGLEKVGHDPTPLPFGFDLALWSGESCLREYVLFYLRMERLYKLFFENKVMRSLINVAPGLAEVSIIGKITSGLRKVGPPMNYDLIVVDCYATGHALAMFLAPKGMQEAIKFGPMGNQSREMQAILQDPDLCSYLLVTLLEELPVTESLEFHAMLKSQLGVSAEIVVNKTLTLPGTEGELMEMKGGLQEFSRYLLAMKQRQEKFSRLLKEKFGEIAQVPLLFTTDPTQLVTQAGDALRKA